MNLNDMIDTNTNHTFLIYNNNCNKNILFLGSCRLSQLLYYYNNLNITELKRNIYYIYVPTWIDKLDSFPKHIINDICKNTDIIICETIKNYSFLNTIKNVDNNFFSTFNIHNTCKIFFIPTLELHIYSHFLINNCNIPYDHELLYNAFIKSKERLYSSLNKYEYPKLKFIIENYLNKIKLFLTINHPSRILFLFLFKELMSKMNIILDRDFLYKMIDINLLSGNNTPIFNIDVALHKLEYNEYIFNTHENLYNKNYCTNYDYTNSEIPSDLLNLW